jgi:prepilin-type N-terminal cleavage/methylation domain-containing protein
MKRTGFTLVEIMLVVTIIGLLAVIAVPSYLKAREQSRISAFVNDLRLAGDAFQLYAMQKGDYPPDANRGVVPDGMAEFLPEMNWAEPSPLGGTWDWERNVFGISAAISVVASDSPESMFCKVDEKVDDGDLTAGTFRRIANNRYAYVME